MDLDAPTPLLAGLTPRAFMRRHWQRRPLLVRQACPGLPTPADRAALFALASNDGVQSRLIERRGDAAWKLRRGPFGRRALPPLSRPGWTLLVQAVDQHLAAAQALLSRFRFVPDARRDDLMVSYASDQGGVGPHVDSYDVFLLQLEGTRRWRVGRCRNAAFVPGLPLKILARFEPEHDWLLEAGDLLYLPPGWAHDGVAVGPCTTASIGFRAPTRSEAALQVLQRAVDGALDDADDDATPATRRYRDAGQPAVDAPARIPPALSQFATAAVQRLLAAPHAIDCALGEWLSEPTHSIDAAASGANGAEPGGVVLAQRSRMLYDDRHVFINGASFIAGGRDAVLLRRLADQRRLDAADLARLSPGARALLRDWQTDGWLRPATTAAVGGGFDT